MLWTHVCINCNKSIRAVSMHLGITRARHVVNIINHGYYDKKTGLWNRRFLNQSSHTTSDAVSVRAAYPVIEASFRE